MKLRKIQKLVYFCLCLIGIILPVSVHAEQTDAKTVRVGWYEDSYHITGQNGDKSGYSYEYEQAVAAYTGWKYEYVKGDWSELLEMLQDGRIDMMGVISYTDERAQSMLFSELPMGEEKYYLYADLTKLDVSASDVSALNGKMIGMLEGSVHETMFRNWEKKHGITTTHVYVDGFEDAVQKLKKGEVDGVLSSESPDWAEEGMSAMLSFGESSDYFAISKKRSDLKAELDAAMQKMEIEKPFYADELHKKYLCSESVESLSGAELGWLLDHGTIRIGYLKDDPGISVYNHESGTVSGVIQDYVSYAGTCLQNAQLEFELIGYDTRKEQIQALKEHNIDMIFHTSQNPSAAEQNGYILSDTVWTFNFAAVTTKDYFDENGEVCVAVPEENLAMQQYISYNYPDWKIREYASEKEAETAVRRGKADCMLVRSSQVVEYLGKHKFKSVFLNQPGDASFAVRRGDTELLSILNKTLRTTQTARFTSAISAYDYSAKKVTFGKFVDDNKFVVISVFAGLLLMVVVVVLIFLRKANRATAKAVELNRKLEKNQEDLERALAQAESANAAKTTFLSNMSHDIRTPINGIIGMLMIIRKSENDPERIQDCLEKIDQSSKLLLSLVNDVLDMAKLEAENVIVDNESINLDQVCDEITTSLVFQAEAEGLHVTGQHDDYSDLYVWSNALYLKKILMNLFSNSMKYNKPNGSIDMSMRTLERSEESIKIEFKIQDTGIGISEEYIKNELFTPFVQGEQSARSSYRGTGLGMPIVKQLVEKMGGTVAVQSKVGEGTCFTVVIPFRIDTQKNGNTLSDDLQYPDGNIEGLHILLVEDNELNMEIAEFMLQDSGARVEKAVNGLEAVRLFEENPAGTYDAILMDIMMPEMDGLTATRTIRAMARPDARTIPIIAMTAKAFREDVEKCLAAGMNAHLSKPLEVDKVKRVIQRQISDSV